VCFGLAEKGRETLTETMEFGPLGRAKVRRATVVHALEMLQRALRATDQA
jgi:nicotinamide-nucleotide amidase